MSQRVADLLTRMTLEEKVSMLAGIDAWRTRRIDRLGIPSIKMTDGPHGTRTMSDEDPNATLAGNCYPTGSALAATWDTELVGQVAAAIGEETREKGCAILLGPCVNIHRSPLGGRNFESLSEDPYLAARLALAYVNGVQSQGVGVSVKHFALNNSEFERFTISSEASERTIREIYLPAFRAAVVEGRAWTVMCSYNRINGSYASENTRFLTEILKQEWGFEGFVVSDWGAVHSTIPAINSGLDMEMPGPPRFFGEALVKAIRAGEVSEARINDAVRRILSVIERSGAFERPITLSEASSDTPERRRLARWGAAQAVVLLRNDGDLLPINRSQVKSIAVIGPNAALARIQGSGSSRVTPYYAVTPLEGIRAQCGDAITVRHEPGCRNDRLTPPLDCTCLRPDKGEGPGLTGRYFNNNDLAGKPILTRRDDRFVLRWGGRATSPGPGVSAEEFSVRWTGWFIAPETGTYRFGLLTDGLARVFVDDRLLVSKWDDPVTMADLEGRGERTAAIEMEKDKAYSIRIEYRKNPTWPLPMRRLRVGCEMPELEETLELAAHAAAASDVAIVIVGTSEEWESEGFDRESMELPGAQVDLIRVVAQANPKTVVILNAGSPVMMTDWLEEVPAALQAWFSGQEGGNAIADVLFGEVNPSGKLPMTLPRRIEDNPAFVNYPGESGEVYYGEGIFVGYRYYDAKKVEPLFPFGHGLSYTTFDYGNLRLPAEAEMDESLTVSVDVSNTGQRQGREVVQLYVRDIVSRLARPPKELKGFAKVGLKPGETKTVSFTLGKDALSFYDPDVPGWVAEPGEFEVQVGSSSRDIRVCGAFTLKPDRA